MALPPEPDGGNAGPPGGGAGTPTPGGGGGPLNVQPGNILASLQGQQKSAGPTAPGAGNMAESLSKFAAALQMIQDSLPGLQGTPAYRDALNILQRLNKHVPQGSGMQGQQQTMFRDMAAGTKKGGFLPQIAQLLGGGGGGAGGGGQPPQQPGNPSVPLPGA